MERNSVSSSCSIASASSSSPDSIGAFTTGWIYLVRGVMDGVMNG
jgi:hypothetical protein